MIRPAPFPPAPSRRREFLCGALALAVPLQAYAADGAGHDHSHGEPQDVLECLGGIAVCSRFAALVLASGMGPELQRMPDITVMAPVNEALSAVPGDPAARRQIVQRHVFATRWAAVGGNDQQITSLHGTRMLATMDDVAGTGFLLQGLPVRNGWVHVMRQALR